MIQDNIKEGFASQKVGPLSRHRAESAIDQNYDVSYTRTNQLGEEGLQGDITDADDMN